MIEEILALSWGTIFWFSLKAISAWVVAMVIVVAPWALFKTFVMDD